MAVGRVKWFNDAKGYGFIERDQAAPSTPTQKSEEIFVHFTAIQGDGHRTLEEGQEVEFDIYEDVKGKTAQNVMPRA
jgi:CspA family cold shock protein